MNDWFYYIRAQIKFCCLLIMFVFSRTASSIEFPSSDGKDLYSQLYKKKVEMSPASVDSVRMAIKDAKVEAATISFHCSKKNNKFKCKLYSAEGIIYPKFD